MEKERRGKRAGLFSLVFCVSAILITACIDKEDTVPQMPVAYVSLYQASPNAPNLDIKVDNRQVNNYPFDYTDNTGYLPFYTGTRNLKFGPFRADNVVIDTTVTFENAKAYSIFVVDEYQDAGIIVLNDNSNAPSSGKAMVRFLNLSPDASPLDLNVNNLATPLFDDQAFKASSDFKEVDATEYDFHVKSGANGTDLLSIPDVHLQPGQYYTFLIRGYNTPPSGNGNVLTAEVIN